MEKNIYLIDSNAFLTPGKSYYRFSLAPSYWRQINELAEKGYIKTIDKVQKEVCPRNKEKDKDEVQLWYENEFKGEIISTNKQNIVDEYVGIIRYLQSSERYSEKAFLEWSIREDVADPWLIATAMAKDYTIISFESLTNYNGGHPMARAKIPNVCQDLNVRYTSLFSMMERLKIEL